jgi:hypothetical protein
VKRCFKGPAEPGSDHELYVEFTDSWPTRQIDVVDGHYYSSVSLAVIEHRCYNQCMQSD